MDNVVPPPLAGYDMSGDLCVPAVPPPSSSATTTPSLTTSCAPPSSQACPVVGCALDAIIVAPAGLLAGLGTAEEDGGRDRRNGKDERGKDGVEKEEEETGVESAADWQRRQQHEEGSYSLPQSAPPSDAAAPSAAPAATTSAEEQAAPMPAYMPASSDFVVTFPPAEIADRMTDILSTYHAIDGGDSNYSNGGNAATGSGGSPRQYLKKRSSASAANLVKALSNFQSFRSSNSIRSTTIGSFENEKSERSEGADRLSQSEHSSSSTLQASREQLVGQQSAARSFRRGRSFGSSSVSPKSRRGKSFRRAVTGVDQAPTPYVEVCINGSDPIPSLEMVYNDGTVSSSSNAANASGTCKFREGSSSKPSQEVLNRLVTGGWVKEGPNDVEFRLVLDLGGGGGEEADDDDDDDDGDESRRELPLPSSDGGFISSSGSRRPTDPYEADSDRQLAVPSTSSSPSSPAAAAATGASFDPSATPSVRGPPPSSSRQRRVIVVVARASCTVHLWSTRDSVIVSDIDGTVTKSDVRGVLDTVVTERYEHAHQGVCRFFAGLAGRSLSSIGGDGSGGGVDNAGRVGPDRDGIKENGGGADMTREEENLIDDNKKKEEGVRDADGREGGREEDGGGGKVRFLYLSSRPISLINSTRKFLNGLVQQQHRLPPGPIFCHPGSLQTVLLTELVYKNADQFKADVLARQVVLPFAAAGRDREEQQQREQEVALVGGGAAARRKRRRRKLFLAGFGNKPTDAAAYEMAGMGRDDIYIIDKESELVCMDGGGVGKDNSPRGGVGSVRKTLSRKFSSFGRDRSDGSGGRVGTVAEEKEGGDEEKDGGSTGVMDCGEAVSATVESMLRGTALDCCGAGGLGSCGGSAVDADTEEEVAEEVMKEATREAPGIDGNSGTPAENSYVPSNKPLNAPTPPPPVLTSALTSETRRGGAGVGGNSNGATPSSSPPPPARQISFLSSKSSYKRYRGMTFRGYADPKLDVVIREKIEVYP